MTMMLLGMTTMTIRMADDDDNGDERMMRPAMGARLSLRLWPDTRKAASDGVLIAILEYCSDAIFKMYARARNARRCTHARA
eukprot:11203263-Lingulodinium_polyedra.AAC.1